MIALALLAAVIGVIVYSSRKGRSEYTVSVKSDRPGETWTFNVRDMRAELKTTSTGEVVESFDLRRSDDGRWEWAKVDDDAPDAGAWSLCDDFALAAIEKKYRSYNAVS